MRMDRRTHSGEGLTEREQQVLEAVIRTYVETAEPAGSRTVARRFTLGVSAATVRNTMSDLEDKGYLFHPHTSAGRIPTDRAYRLYVNSILAHPRLPAADERSLRRQLQGQGERSAVEQIVRRAAQVMGLLTRELGVAIGPRLDEAVLEKLELVPLSDAKLLIVLALRAGGVRTVYVDVPAHLPASAIAPVAQVLNERLAGATIRDIRASLPERLRDSFLPDDRGAAELLNVFIQSADELLDAGSAEAPEVHLGSASVLADQPEFSSGERLRSLIELTERRDLLQQTLGGRLADGGLQITIGQEHQDPALADFTLITSEYSSGNLRGVVGVIGPTRMPYDRVLSVVQRTSALISELLQ
jgi:heat-inducible transcriptional repressor